MTHIIVGLGNPGKEYEKTRHNVGRMAVSRFAEKYDFDNFSKDNVLKSLKSKSNLKDQQVILLLPETYMNRSGFSLVKLVRNKKTLNNLIVVHDDVDLPIGVVKISYARGSGGHKGVESIKKSLNSNEFIRVRIGVIPTTPGGKLKKPNKDKMNKFVTSEFSSSEKKLMEKVITKTVQLIEEIIVSGRETASNLYN